MNLLNPYNNPVKVLLLPFYKGESTKRVGNVPKAS